ncbi:MAG: general secretion pathway protein GspK [Thermodesulfobacteriota bacterium]
MKKKRFIIPHRWRWIQNNRGIALFLTLSIVSLITIISMTLHRRSRDFLSFASAHRDRLTRVEMSSSGIHTAMSILARDKALTTADSIQEDWANPQFLSTITDQFSFEDGRVSITISDEMGKIQINALVKYPEGRHFNELQKELWLRLLTSLKDQSGIQEGFEAESILNAVKDWLDFGDGDAISGINGAESAYYLALTPPYSSRNGSMVQLSEIVLVKGIGPDLLNRLGGIRGVSNYLTVFGAVPSNNGSFTFEGKVNINTASLPILTSLLPPSDQILAKFIDDYRRETAGSKFIHDLSDPAWYRKVPGCGDLKIDPGMMTISSDVFRIESTAELNGIKTTTIAVIIREKEESTDRWTCKVLSWEVL